MDMPPSERAAFADRHGLSEPYLYQCLTGRKDMKPAEAVRVEQESKGALMRWHLRTTDWFLIWPELIGAKGAPEIPAAAVSS